jgi:hypothetical protein
MPEVIIQLIIVMLICGFCYWVWTLVRPMLPLAGPFAQIVDVLVIILIAVIVLFYAIIPLLRMLPRLLH